MEHHRNQWQRCVAVRSACNCSCSWAVLLAVIHRISVLTAPVGSADGTKDVEELHLNASVHWYGGQTSCGNCDPAYIKIDDYACSNEYYLGNWEDGVKQFVDPLDPQGFQPDPFCPDN